jgi:GGDEF domain-containing protein
MVLNLFITAFSLTNLFPFASWVSLIVATGVFTGTAYGLLDSQFEFIVSAVVATAVFLITAIICNIYSHVVTRIDQKYASLQQVADSLAIYDQSTNLMRWKYAKQTLITEILRGRRYHNDVTLVLFDYRERDQFSNEDIQENNKLAAEVLLDGIRTNLDIAFISDQLGLILPETGYKGALILAQRLVQKLNRQVGARVVAGLSSFPEDAITEDEIILQAKAALQAALDSDQTLEIYHNLNSENHDSPDLAVPPAEEPEGEQDQRYVNILESIHLDDDQWVVWIEGFDKMDDLAHIEEVFNAIDHVQEINFLFLQENHLVIKIRSGLADLIDAPSPFPGWVVVKTSPENRYLLIRENKEPVEA